MQDSSRTVRIIDASLNRAGEGIRVAEDYVRFVLDDKHLARLLKELRHELTEAAGGIELASRLECRDAEGDVGASLSTTSERQRTSPLGVCQASFERAKQALRSLEEFVKLVDPPIAAQFEAIRYQLYSVEAAVRRTADAVERLATATLCILVDGRDSEDDFVALISELVAAGVDVIQLRDKRLTDQELTCRARLLVQLTRYTGAETADQSNAPGVIAIVNDRADIAAVSGADGVHVGQDDITPADARRIVGPGKLVGVSTHNIQQARQVVLDGANYLGAGPTFPSRTKQFADFPGPAFLSGVAAEVRLPTFAIGGISADNLSQVLATGVGRIAVSGAVLQADSVAEAVGELRAMLEASEYEVS